MRVHINQQFLDNSLTCPVNRRRIEYCDLGLPGFLIETRSSGLSTYWVRWKDDSNRTRYVKLAKVGEIDLKTAKKKAKELKAEISLGRNPASEREEKRNALTLDEFFTQHFLPHVQSHLRSWKKYEEYYRTRIKKRFGQKRLNQLTKQELQEFHTDVRNEGLAESSTDHFLKLIRRCLNLAVEWGYLEKNPATRIRLFNPDNRVEHYLDDAQLIRLVETLRTDKNRTVSLVILWALVTAARRNEILQAKWSQIDREARVWRIPASNSKSKRIRSVPLSDTALEILDELDTEGKYEYIFVNKKTGQSMKWPERAWRRIKIKAQIPKETRFHDLRHTAASQIAQAGGSMLQIQALLGHSSYSVTERYIHLNRKNLEDTVRIISDKIQGAGCGSDT